MQITIISPDQEMFNGEAKLIQFPGVEGSFAVLPDHAMMIASLAAGVIRIVSPKDKSDFIEIKGGVVEVRDNIILVLAL